MAVVTFSREPDQPVFNLGDLRLTSDEAGYVDDPVTFQGEAYDGFFFAIWGVADGEGDSTFFVTDFYGDGFVQNDSGAVTGGTVEAIAHSYYDPGLGEWVEMFSITGLSISAAAFYKAAMSKTTADDKVILKAVFGGDDVFHLSDRDDRASGLGGDDRMSGYGGRDILGGGAGHDTISGGDGNDRLMGEGGRDILRGDAGNDAFVFSRVTDSGTSAVTADVIGDFTRGRDRIDLKAMDAFAASGANEAFVWRGTGAFTSATKGEVGLRKFDNAGRSNDYTLVLIDTDGDSGTEMAIRLNGLHDLTAADFIL